jgi:nucleotide-binding universal stress UspA family protein
MVEVKEVMEMNGFVVGVDGSAASVAALRWAVAQAAAQRCPITAVEVRPAEHPLPGTSYAIQPYGSAPPVERTRTRLHETVAAILATVKNPPHVVELHLQGDAAAELVRVAQEAQATLVLGYTPHSRVTEFLLGRVTGECLRHSRTPVVLVPVSGR